MTVSEAALLYVQKRQAEGRQFVTAGNTLRLLCKSCGEVNIRSLSSEQVFLFINSGNRALATRIHRSSTVKCFIDHWVRQGQMQPLVYPKLPRPAAPPALYIYTPTEVREMLRSAKLCQRRCVKLGGSTLRAILTTIYATGASLNEVLTLRVSGVDLRRHRIVFDPSPYKPGRTLPIGSDLCAILSQHLDASKAAEMKDRLLFVGGKGDAISRNYINSRFVRLCRMLGLKKRSDGRTARLLDLRYTFAVHRLTHWIRQGVNLNSYLPALSTYMGYASLTSAEKFLSYTPERFKADLQKLSPAKSRKHWRDDPELISLLKSL